jgi:hypothetical protein
MAQVKLNLVKLSCKLAIAKSKKSRHENLDVCLLLCKGGIYSEQHRIGYFSAVKLMNKSVTGAQTGTCRIPAYRPKVSAWCMQSSDHVEKKTGVDAYTKKKNQNTRPKNGANGEVVEA